MKKVLQILPSLENGGVERQVYYWYQGLKKHVVFDFVVNGSNVGYIEKKILSDGGTVYHVPKFGENIFTNFYNTYKIIRSGKYNIVHIHHSDKSFVQLFSAFIAGTKLRIAHSHDSIIHTKKIDKLLHKSYCSFIRLLANRYVACSKSAAEWIFKGKALKKTIIISNIIDLTKFKYDEPIRKKYRKELSINGKLVLGHIGRFAKQKNHVFLIELMKKLIEYNKNIVLLLVGEGELKESIECLVRSNNLNPYIRFLGIRDDIPQIMSAMDIFLLPSFHEGFGIVLLEAQVIGLQCIASEFVPAEVKKTESLFFLELDTQKWIDKIKYLSDQKRLSNTSNNLSGFDLISITNKLINLYS